MLVMCHENDVEINLGELSKTKQSDKSVSQSVSANQLEQKKLIFLCDRKVSFYMQKNTHRFLHHGLK